MAARTLATFSKGGVHPRECKEYTAKLPVEIMPPPSEVFLYLKQHIGAPCQICVRKRIVTPPPEERLFLRRHSGAILQLVVRKKDRVAEGDRIGSPGQALGANLHASVGGTVEGVVDAPHPLEGKASALAIARDPEARPRSYCPVDWRQFSREELLARISDAGIVGLGGAGFPAHAKLKLKPGVKVDTLIINGAECEPYLTCDHRIMVEHPQEIVEGAKIILTILGISNCIIGIENNKPDAIEALNQALVADHSKNGFNIVVRALKVKYPQGAADQMMESLTGRVRPSGVRSSAIGIIVQNVYTTKTIYDAVVLGKPLFERVVTISGRGIARQANLLIRMGTKLSDIVAYLGGVTADLAKVVMGGPMTGFAVSSLDVSISKTTSGVLFLTKDEVDIQSYGPCIRCGLCVEVCPMGLQPNYIGMYVEAGRGAETEQFGITDEYDIEDCFECGSCAYVCPAKRPLVQFGRLAKIMVREAKKKE